MMMMMRRTTTIHWLAAAIACIARQATTTIRRWSDGELELVHAFGNSFSFTLCEGREEGCCTDPATRRFLSGAGCAVLLVEIFVWHKRHNHRHIAFFLITESSLQPIGVDGERRRLAPSASAYVSTSSQTIQQLTSGCANPDVHSQARCFYLGCCYIRICFTRPCVGAGCIDAPCFQGRWNGAMHAVGAALKTKANQERRRKRYQKVARICETLSILECLLIVDK